MSAKRKEGKLRSGRRIIAAALGAFLFLPAGARGFSEDVCYFYRHEGAVSTAAEIVPLPFNCYDLECTDGPGSGADEGQCFVRGLTSYAATALLHNLHGRNTIHFDVLWLLARANGMSAGDAGLLAAYSQATDLGLYQHYDVTGKPLDGVKSEDINGVTRLNFATSGFWLHYVPWFREKGSTTRTQPFVFDFGQQDPAVSPLPAWEAPLNHLRSWAFGARDTACAFGLTDGAGNCFDDLAGTEAKTLQLSVPLVNPVAVRDSVALGWQRIKPCAEPAADGCYEAGYAGEIKGTLAALGIYLHALDDRISHFLCSDSSFIEPLEEAAPFDYALNYAFSCGQLVHIGMHYRETGHQPVPPRTVKAILVAWQELDSWLRMTGYRREQKPRPAPGAREKIAARLVAALAEPCAAERLQSLCTISKSLGLGWHDGNETCRYPTFDCTESP